MRGRKPGEVTLPLHTVLSTAVLPSLASAAPSASRAMWPAPSSSGGQSGPRLTRWLNLRGRGPGGAGTSATGHLFSRRWDMMAAPRLRSDLTTTYCACEDL